MQFVGEPIPLLIALTLSTCGAALAQPTTAPATSAPVEPAPFYGLEDNATFWVFKAEERLITIKTRLSADGALESEAVLSMAGQEVRTTLSITPDAHGRWKSMKLVAPTGPISLERDGATITRGMRGKHETLTLKPDAVTFENFTPTLISHAIRSYDRSRGGKQTIPIFIIPAVVMDGTLEFSDKVRRTVGGRDLEFDRYVYGLPGVDLTVWTDADGRIYFVDVPAQDAAYVREGYESLRRPEVVDPLLSQPTHEVIEQRGVKVPMRDGVHLSTDIYLPSGEGRFPVILIRTPYKKEVSELEGKYYARRGYALALQDTRGRFGSEGVWEPCVNEAADGYDAIEWLAAQPWSSGKVGMIGGSYVGWVQWWAASLRPPHLVTIIPNVAPPDPLLNVPYEYGVFFLFGATWWADVLGTEATGDLSGVAMSAIGDKDYHTLLRGLPVIELDHAVFGKQNPWWRKWIENNFQNDYWERASFLDRLDSVRIPVFHQSGWFDGDGIGSKLNYLKMASHGHPHQKLILGPWGHTDEAHRMVGERDFTETAIIDLSREYLRWFDYWLKGIDNGIAREPLVRIFVMGANRWLTGETYPLPGTRFEKWYLDSGGKANTSEGDGRLGAQPPTDAPSDRYTYDPADPTPAPQLPPTSAIESETDIEVQRRKAREYPALVARTRSDVLVYTSEPLTTPLTFAGPISAVLYASSSAKDTDWFVRLSEIEADGDQFVLVEGRLRARFRESLRQPKLLEPGKLYEYHVDLWQTGIRIPAGHRLRVEVASASFPMFSRNLNTGGHNEMESNFVPAEQTVYHSAEYPSHVLLPVIPDAEAAAPPN